MIRCFTGDFYQIIKTKPSQIVQKNKREGNISKLILKGQITPIPKIDKDTTRKLQSNNSD